MEEKKTPKPKERKLWTNVHHNANICCSIDTETTSLDPFTGEIVQIAIVPLKPDYSPNNEFPFLELLIQPSSPKIIEGDAFRTNREVFRKACEFGLERWTAVQRFEDWFYSMRLPPGKKITPLGHNYLTHDRPFISSFLGGQINYEHFFRSDVRDTYVFAQCLNDMAAWHSERVPFARSKLSNLASYLQITNDNEHDALQDAITTAKCYARMLKSGYFLSKPTVEKLLEDKVKEIIDDKVS